MMLTELPQEVVEELAEYLSLSDVLSSSAVSSDWRNAFNSNKIWRRFCSFHPSYFCNQVSKVDHSDIQVSDVCEARQQLFKERMVKSNLARGAYHVDEIEVNAKYCENVVDHIDEAGNHWLFASCLNRWGFEREHMLMVWNMNDSPVLHASVETPLSFSSRGCFSAMKVNKSKLFYISKDVVLVYSFARPDFELSFLHKVEPSEMGFLNLNPFCVDTAMVWWNNAIVGFCYSCYHKELSIPPSVFVWDEEGLLTFKGIDSSFLEEMSNKVVQEQVMPAVIVKSNTFNITVAYNYSNEVEWVFQLLDMQCLEYHKLGVFDSPLGISLFGASSNLAFAAIPGVKCVNCYCFSFDSKSKLLWTSNFEVPKVYSNEVEVFIANETKYLVFVNGSKVVLFDILLGVKVLSFNGHPLHFLNYGVRVWTDSILVYQCNDETQNYHEVWDYKSGQKLYTLNLCPPLQLSVADWDICRFSINDTLFRSPKVVAFHATRRQPEGGTKIVVISFW